MVYNLEGSWLDLRLEPIYLTQLGWPLSLKKLPIKLCTSEAILHDANMILNRVTQPAMKTRKYTITYTTLYTVPKRKERSK